MTLEERFKALPESKRNKILDDNRSFNTEGVDWDYYLIERFKEDMLERGFRVNKVYWSGFACQGDGACFTGYITDFTRVMKVHDLTYRMIDEVRERDCLRGFGFVIGHDGHYYHEHSMSYDESFELEDRDEPNVLLAKTYEVLREDATKEWEDFCTKVKELCQGYARELYAQLKEEHDYLTSDESVTEALLANEVIFEAALAEAEEE